MLNPFKKVSRFYTWWISTLLSCLPEKWNKYLSDLKSNINLVIKHHENSIVIMNDQGEILESVPLSSSAGIETGDLASEKMEIAGFSDSELVEVGKLMPDIDPPLYSNADSVDLDLTGRKGEPGAETLDIILEDETQIILGDETLIIDGNDSNFGSADNVVSLKINSSDDSTFVLESEDQTVRLPGGFSDDDTIVIKDDQGNLVQLDSTNPGAGDRTLLFCSDGGKIRPVGVSDLESSGAITPDEKQKLRFENISDSVDSSDYKTVAGLLETYQRNKRCLYLLPDSKVFKLNLSYPIEAIQDIESVLKYDLEKHIPLSFHEIRYFYALNVRSSQNKVDAEVAVIKSEEYDLLNLSLKPFVKKGLFCTTESFFKNYGNTISFLEHKLEKSWRSLFKLSNLHLGFNLVLLFILMALPFLLFYQDYRTIEEKSPQEIARVKELVTSFNSINAESNFGTELTEIINISPRSVELLSILSSDINKQAWLTRFSLKGNQIKVKGEADSATSVSDDLNKTGIFKSIKFVSSIVKNSRSGKETFELLLVLKSDA